MVLTISLCQQEKIPSSRPGRNWVAKTIATSVAISPSGALLLYGPTNTFVIAAALPVCDTRQTRKMNRNLEVK